MRLDKMGIPVSSDRREIQAIPEFEDRPELQVMSATQVLQDPVVLLVIIVLCFLMIKQ